MMRKKEIILSDISTKNISELIQLACHYNSEIFLEDKYCRIENFLVHG